ncbi:metalloregulator ArsR/SmtB family transcription factor [Mycobacterium sp. NPDC050853]|uniref:ArsR/SmtB family transcription factor n=1 Tax=Mycobacteriaceae TaxID=1762 RepID=UPI0015DF5D31|nr:winged helix-turn-helix transcriptional regulator [Mycobacteroides sp. LB1]
MPPASIDRTLAALADPNRRKIVEALRDRPCRAGEIAQVVGLSPAALSRHLRTLKASELVQESHPEFDARVRIYTLRPAPMAELKAWIDQIEKLWATQLVAFKDHIERQSDR